MIDAAKAKRLRNQALQLALSEGRVTGNIETKGYLRRIFRYDRGRLSIEYIAPLYADAPRVKTVRPSAYTISIRFNGSKVLGMSWDDTRTAVQLMKPGGWEHWLTS